MTASEGSSLKVAVAYVGGSSFRVFVALRQFVVGSLIQLQKRRSQESWSSVVPKEVVSAESVLGQYSLNVFASPTDGIDWAYMVLSDVLMSRHYHHASVRLWLFLGRGI